MPFIFPAGGPFPCDLVDMMQFPSHPVTQESHDQTVSTSLSQGRMKPLDICALSIVKRMAFFPLDSSLKIKHRCQFMSEEKLSRTIFQQRPHRVSLRSRSARQMLACRGDSSRPCPKPQLVT